MRQLLVLLFTLVGLHSYCQHAANESYVVTANDDTTYCSSIKMKGSSITCQTKNEKVEIRNETVRRIFLPVEKSDWSSFFESYAKSKRKKGYTYSPDKVKEVLATGSYPRFFDLKPLNPDEDFWTRGLFEILAENNGYKLCKLKDVKGSRPSAMGESSSDLNTYVVFEENKGKGLTLTKKNANEWLHYVLGDCKTLNAVLDNEKINFAKDMPQILAAYATCN